MKRFIISLILIFATWQTAFAMSYERAREEALYLTDKMAYELNLNDQQYNDAYEINLDYFLALDSEADLYADYLSYRLSDLRHILYDWQYNLLLAADYFIRPVYWRAGGWYFPIYAHYSVGYFYYSYPTVYYNYRGGHGRVHYHTGFYASRRPVWTGGLRGHQPLGGRPSRIGHSTTPRNGGRGFDGRRQYETPRRGFDRGDRGNSFGNSSSRNPRLDNTDRNRDGNLNRDIPNRNSDIQNRNHENISRPRENDIRSNVERSSTPSRGGSFNRPTTSSNHGDMNSSRSSRFSRSSMSSSRGSSSSRSGGFSGGSRVGGGGATRGGRR